MNDSKRDSHKLDMCVRELFTTLAGKLPNTTLSSGIVSNLVDQAASAAEKPERENRIDAIASFFHGFLNEAVDKKTVQSVFDKHFKI